jgi:hypothetical protein
VRTITDDFPEGVAMLRKAYEMGILDEKAYRSAMLALGISDTSQADIFSGAEDSRGDIQKTRQEHGEKDQDRT